MRKVIMLNRLSLDGFYAGPDGEIDWFIQDPEVDKAAHEMMQPDTLLLGRVTYQLFESYWPQVAKDPHAPEADRRLADELTQMVKVVFSKSLEEVHWENTQLIKGNVTDDVRALKGRKGADITIFGSGTIVQLLANEGLIDEYLVILTPVVLGRGEALFKEVKNFSLELKQSRIFDSGNVLLHYTI